MSSQNSEKFKKRVRSRRIIISFLSFGGFILIMSLSVVYSYLMIINMPLMYLTKIVLVGDVVKIVFCFVLSWILRSLYLNNIDVVISKMELYEMKNIHTILEYEIKKMEHERKERLNADKKVNDITMKIVKNQDVQDY